MTPAVMGRRSVPFVDVLASEKPRSDVPSGSIPGRSHSRSGGSVWLEGDAKVLHMTLSLILSLDCLVAHG